MIPAWYQRMNPRERLLSWIVAGTVFVLLNLWILSWIFGALGGARKELAARRATMAEQALYVKERDLWMKRDEWIRQHQPTLKNPAEASALTFAYDLHGKRWETISENTPDPRADGGGILVTPVGQIILGGMVKGQAVTSRATLLPKKQTATNLVSPIFDLRSRLSDILLLS